MTTPLFLLRSVELGISIRDLDLLTIGLVLDMWTEKANVLPTQSNSFTQGVLKTNTALIHSRLNTVGYKSMERRKANA